MGVIMENIRCGECDNCDERGAMYVCNVQRHVITDRETRFDCQHYEPFLIGFELESPTNDEAGAQPKRMPARVPQ